jgi:hypothetical protein
MWGVESLFSCARGDGFLANICELLRVTGTAPLGRKPDNILASGTSRISDIVRKSGVSVVNFEINPLLNVLPSIVNYNIFIDCTDYIDYYTINAI